MTSPVVLITGAGSGIGRAAVELYAERGHRVIAVDIDADRLSALAAGGQVLTFAGDVAAAEASEQAVQWRHRRHVIGLGAARGSGDLGRQRLQGGGHQPGPRPRHRLRGAEYPDQRDRARLTATALTVAQTADPSLEPYLTRRIPQQ
jgi:hypothetical protein